MIKLIEKHQEIVKTQLKGLFNVEQAIAAWSAKVSKDLAIQFLEFYIKLQKENSSYLNRNIDEIFNLYISEFYDKKDNT